MDTARRPAPVEDDKDAQGVAGHHRGAGGRTAPFFLIYVCSPDIAEEILDYTVTFGCDTPHPGKTRRKAIARAIEGDVVSKIAALAVERGAARPRRSPDGTHTTEAVPHGPTRFRARTGSRERPHSGVASPPGENGQRARRRRAGTNRRRRAALSVGPMKRGRRARSRPSWENVLRRNGKVPPVCVG